MDLKEEIIQNVKKGRFDREEEGSLIEEFEEIFAFEDSLEEEGPKPKKPHKRGSNQ